jgi:hypothetical protein
LRFASDYLGKTVTKDPLAFPHEEIHYPPAAPKNKLRQNAPADSRNNKLPSEGINVPKSHRMSREGISPLDSSERNGLPGEC